MQETNPSSLTSESIQMLISSLTNQGHDPVPEIALERFLNALARVQSGVPTGVPTIVEPNTPGNVEKR